MSTSNELSEIIITIDTREKSQKRISAVEQWGLKHGAVVEHDTLKLCDYKIEGSFHNKSFNTDVDINIGIEAKSISDFATSYNELPHKLASAFKQYQDVALFIEMGNYTFNVDSDDFHATIVNPAVRTGDANVLPLAVMEGILESIQTDGVHVRQLRSEAHFPYAIANILLYISKPYHSGLHIDNEDFHDNYLNVLAKIPGIGYKSGLRLLKRYPNLSWLTSADVSAYQEALGNLKGKILDSFVHDHSLETEDWRNNYFKNGSEIQPCSNCHSKQCHCKKPYEPERICVYCGYKTPNSICPVCGKTTNPNPSHTATTPIQNTTYSKVAGDRRGFSKTPPYTPTPPAVTSHSITKGLLQNMDDRQGQVSPPMIDPTANSNSDISYTGGYTEIEPNRQSTTFTVDPIQHFEVQPIKQSMQDPDSIKTNTHDKPDPATIIKSKTTHKMSLKHHLVEWFENPHTLQETVDAYGMKQEMGVGAWSGDRIFNMVVNSEKQGLLRAFTKNNQIHYVMAVKPDLELDIGV